VQGYLVQDVSLLPVSEDALLLSLDTQEENATPDQAALLGGLANYLLNEVDCGIVNVVPAYKTLLLQYDVLRVSLTDLEQLLRKWFERHSDYGFEFNGRLHTIPVFYDSRVGPDLVSLATEKSLDINALITLHTRQTYSVYAVGFQPGFAYLGYVDEQLNAARHTSFKANVAAGSVGIADRQTAIYPSDSPGGWQIIGRTPTDMWPHKKPLLRTGDLVQFVSIDEGRYLALGGVL